MLYTVLEHETVVPPLDIYIETTAIQRASTVYNHPVEKEIRQTLKYIKKARAT